ncbi:MAG: hypothetical protein ACOH2N_16130 [Devosia sp.]
MTPRLLALLAHDLRLQFRYGIYLAYGFVVALYAACLVWGAAYLPTWAPAAIIFTDPAALGFFFLGALMMLERAENVRMALSTTPVTGLDYYLSKLLTLLGLSLSAGLVLLIVRGSDNAPLLLASVALTSVQYVAFGVLAAYQFRTVSGYLIGSAVILTPLIAPGFLALLAPFPNWLVVIPAVSQLRLFLVATHAEAATPAALAAMLTICAIAAGGASWLAVRRLRQEFGK